MDNNLDTTGGVVPPTVVVVPSAEAEQQLRDAELLTSSTAGLDLPAAPNNAIARALDAPPMTALQHVEAWWAELKASMPRPDLKSFDTHAAEQWYKLVARLRGL